MSLPVSELEQTIAQLTAPGKGILAADESTGTIQRRFETIGLANTEENRRDYRELLFSTPGLGEFLGGAILFEETLGQRSSTGVALAEMLAAQGIVPGIKVDLGTVALPGFPEEKITQGLDGLAERLAGYKKQGARFAKWRAVITIGDSIPSAHGLATHAWALARYAAICQHQGIVPIVEPEVLMDGNHGMARCASVTEQTLHTVFHALYEHRVAYEYMILKPNMITYGRDSNETATAGQIAEATLACLRRTVPAAVPGIYFLSGGQGEAQASANLNAMNSPAGRNPWVVSFSYGRALQDSALKAWRGDAANRAAAQQALHHRARLNSAAREGNYAAAMEDAVAMA